MSYTIGEVAVEIGMSADTLRYYEKIRLLPPPGRTPGGKRIYREQDLARLRFIQRAQSVGFSLVEIGKLLRFRENPAKASRAVRELAVKKHDHVKAQLKLLQTIDTELNLLLSICRGEGDNCPILKALDGDIRQSAKRRRA